MIFQLTKSEQDLSEAIFPPVFSLSVRNNKADSVLILKGKTQGKKY